MVPKISICFTDLTNFSFTKSFVSALEGAGTYAVFFPENSHVPIQRPKTLKSFPDIKRLARFYDPFPCLSALAALTEDLKLGTSVCLLTQRDLTLSRTPESLFLGGFVKFKPCFERGWI